jgi:hypothetical protein
MDELDRVRAAHATVPSPDAPTVDRARRRLADAVGAASIRAAPRRRRQRSVRLTAVAGLAGVVAVLAVALWPSSESGPAGPSSALAARMCVQSGTGPATACLDALGDLAAADDVLAGGKVFYRRDLWTQSTMYVRPDGRPEAAPHARGSFAIVRAGSQELWVAPDRSGRVIYGPAQRPYLPSAADERAWRAAGNPDLERLAGGAQHREDLAPQEFTEGQLDKVLLGSGALDEVLPQGDPLRGLSTEPTALARELRRIAWYQRVRISGEGPCAQDLHDCSPSTRRNIASQYGGNLRTLLRYPFASPDLRRALLHLLGDLPGARRMGAVRDPAGRRGAAIVVPESINDGLNVIVFDLATGRLLADGHADDGTVATLRWQDVYDLKVGGVGKIGERPR